MCRSPASLTSTASRSATSLRRCASSRVAEALPQRLQERGRVLRGTRSPDPRRDRRRSSCPPRQCESCSSRRPAAGSRSPLVSSSPARAVDVDPFDDVSLELLRLRRSAKWAKYPPDVLPAWSPRWISRSRCRSGRPSSRRCAGRHRLRRPGQARGVVRALRRRSVRMGHRPGAGQARRGRDVGCRGAASGPHGAGGRGGRDPARLPALLLDHARGRKERRRIPLARGWPDLAGLEQAFAAGARAYLISHPHNPTGTSLERAELESVAALAARHGVIVIATRCTRR